MTMANNSTSKSRDVYSTPGIDVDIEPSEKIGAKTSFWNTQVEILKEASAKVHAHDGDHAVTVLVEDDEHPDGDIVLKDGITSKDVTGGWKFYPGAQDKGHEIVKKFPGIERRKGEYNGAPGLFMRWNPVLAHEIEHPATDAKTSGK